MAAIRAHLRQGHAAMRDVVAGLSTETLDWTSGPQTNSVAVLLVHALDAERHLTAFVAGLNLERDREAAFRVRGLTADELAAQIDTVQGDVDDHLTRITSDALASPLTRGQRTATGAWWLLHALGHSREHLGQAALSRQLAERRPEV